MIVVDPTLTGVALVAFTAGSLFGFVLNRVLELIADADERRRARRRASDG